MLYRISSVDIIESLSDSQIAEMGLRWGLDGGIDLKIVTLLVLLYLLKLLQNAIKNYRGEQNLEK